MITICHLDHISAEVELELPMPMRLFKPGSLPTYCYFCLEPIDYEFALSSICGDIQHIQAHTDEVHLLCGAIRPDRVSVDEYTTDLDSA